MKDLGYGEGYRYAHDEPDAYAAGETYLPDGMKRVHWYEPTEQGVEQRIRERLQYLRGLDRHQRKEPDKTSEKVQCAARRPVARHGPRVENRAMPLLTFLAVRARSRSRFA